MYDAGVFCDEGEDMPSPLTSPLPKPKSNSGALLFPALASQLLSTTLVQVQVCADVCACASTHYFASMTMRRVRDDFVAM
jgi:hypothetical protein